MNQPQHIKSILKGKPCPITGMKWCERCLRLKDKFTPIKEKYPRCATCHTQVTYLKHNA